MLKIILPAVGLLAFATSVGCAHVALETGEAAAGSSYKAVFRVPHGCDGSSTVKITVKVPEGVIAVKPMPHPGWTIDIVKGKYAKAYDYWIAPELPPGEIYFPVVQECEKGVDRWIEIPEAGKPEPETPAPGVKVLPKQ